MFGFVRCAVLSSLVVGTLTSESSLKDIGDTRNKRDSHISYKLAWIQPCTITYSSNGTKPDGTSIELAATERVDSHIMGKAARLVQLISRFAGRDTLTQFSKIRVGIFSSSELLTDAFPEYEVSAECKFSCEGTCATFCYNDIPRANRSSIAGPRAVIADSNVACTTDNPEQGINLLVKMFAESIFTLLPEQIIAYLTQNFVEVGWNVSPRTTLAYWTEGVVTWFYARTSQGAMNICGPNGETCSDEWQNRQNIKSKDPIFYGFLNTLFNYDRDYLIGKITTCNW